MTSSRRQFPSAEPFLRGHLRPIGEATANISPILTAIRGRWHITRSSNFSRASWCCLIEGQIIYGP